MILDALVSTLLNLVLLAGIPLGGYALVQRWRHRQPLRESARRAGLQLGDPRYLLHAALLTAVAVTALIIWTPPLEPFMRPGSPQRQFVGLGVTPLAALLAALYGFVKTGFPEELLFRGLIAGSLGRHMAFTSALLIQGVIFLLPHLALLSIMPELRGLLLVVFAGGIVAGWLRLRSQSILAPWLVHGAVNTAICLSVAARTAGGEI